MKTKVIKSYAKINVSLDVMGNTSDGYHIIDTVILPLEMHDTIILNEIKKRENYITMDDSTISDSKYNLCSLSLDQLNKIKPFKEKFTVFIHKVIPIQAGLGGGSSNAAFLVKGINKFLDLNIDNETLKTKMSAIGTDVPFFIDCQPSHCTNLGEICEPIEVKNDYYVLIVKPYMGCSTKKVYELTSEKSCKTHSNDVIEALKSGNDDKLAASIYNSLEKAAISLCPEIKDAMSELRNMGAKVVFMTGSGSAVIAMSQNKKELIKYSKLLGDKYNIYLTKVKKN